MGARRAFHVVVSTILLLVGMPTLAGVDIAKASAGVVKGYTPRTWAIDQSSFDLDPASAATTIALGDLSASGRADLLSGTLEVFGSVPSAEPDLPYLFASAFSYFESVKIAVEGNLPAGTSVGWLQLRWHASLSTSLSAFSSPYTASIAINVQNGSNQGPATVASTMGCVDFTIAPCLSVNESYWIPLTVSTNDGSDSWVEVYLGMGGSVGGAIGSIRSTLTGLIYAPFGITYAGNNFPVTTIPEPNKFGMFLVGLIFFRLSQSRRKKSS